MKTKKPSFLATAAAVLLLLALSRATATAQDDLATPPPPGSFRLLNGVDMPLVGFGTAGLGDRSEAAPLYALLLGFRVSFLGWDRKGGRRRTGQGAWL